MQSQDFRKHLLVRLIDVAVNQVLQAARFALELHEKPVRLAHPSDVIPGAAEHVRPFPYEERENDGHRRVERGDREQTPSDRQHTQKRLRGQVHAAPRLCSLRRG